MNKLFVIVFLSLGASLISCNKGQESGDNKNAGTIDVSKIHFASDMDPVCNMSVKDHVKDTASYNGKVYGFCSETCKEEFKKHPENYTK